MFDLYQQRRITGGCGMLCSASGCVLSWALMVWVVRAVAAGISDTCERPTAPFACMHCSGSRSWCLAALKCGWFVAHLHHRVEVMLSHTCERLLKRRIQKFVLRSGAHALFDYFEYGSMHLLLCPELSTVTDLCAARMGLRCCSVCMMA